MDDRIRDIAKKMGATIVAELPDVGHGPLGAAHYAAFYARRMADLRGQELDDLQVGKRFDLKDGRSVRLMSVPISEQTAHALADISRAFERIEGHPRPPMLIAAECVEMMSRLIAEEFHNAETKLRAAEQYRADAQAAATEAQRAVEALEQAWQAAIARIVNNLRTAG